uniref:Uncharacterized protein n=1 Tax=uncultured marine virus TaxID=186617 RepID=A0A0F7L4G3_9VIRU|nr:hypothetical protein [uncultured marine virus]
MICFLGSPVLAAAASIALLIRPLLSTEAFPPLAVLLRANAAAEGTTFFLTLSMSLRTFFTSPSTLSCIRDPTCR